MPTVCTDLCTRRAGIEGDARDARRSQGREQDNYPGQPARRRPGGTSETCIVLLITRRRRGMGGVPPEMPPNRHQQPTIATNSNLRTLKLTRVPSPASNKHDTLEITRCLVLCQTRRNTATTLPRMVASSMVSSSGGIGQGIGSYAGLCGISQIWPSTRWKVLTVVSPSIMAATMSPL
jgi:hypothetical protein